MRRTYKTSAAILACAVLLHGSGGVAAQQDDHSTSPQSAHQQTPVSDVEEPSEGTLEGIPGYGDEGRRIGGPTDVDHDLDFSFPKHDSVLPRLVPEKYFKWKEDLYEKYGLKLGFSYQAIYQHASATTDFFRLEDENEVAAGRAILEGKWDMYNRGQDFQGSLVATLDWITNFTNGKNSPASWGTFNVGSAWPTDFAYIEWEPWVPVAYWEQWFKKDRFVLRIGNQIANQIYDFFRFKDPRVAFSGTPLTAPASAMPFPGPGLAAAFEMWPVKDSPLYIVGTINNQNFVIEEWNWDTAVREADFFYGLEVGYNWARGEGDFDHLHLNLFYADKPAKNPFPLFPNDSGWGFKLAGEKQIGRLVGFGSYTYNTAEGGPFGLTLAQNQTTAGLALLRPFGIRGEIAMAMSWADPINKNQRDQYGLEAYWKILLLPNVWITPGLQLIFDPTFNPQEDTVAIGQIKARMSF